MAQESSPAQPSLQPTERSQPAPAPAATIAPIARCGEIEISRQQVTSLLIDAYGLNMLLNVVQLELARHEALQAGVTVGPQDIAQERTITLQRMFKDANDKQLDRIADAELRGDRAELQRLREQLNKDNELLLGQFLKQQHLTEVEFDLLMQSNAHLRKVVARQIEGRITEQNVREAFLTLYGENVRVRHIQLANLAEVAEAQQRLSAGESFEEVAQQLSRNAATGKLGGELPPFGRETPGLPESFKQVAFTLKSPGEISAPVEANGSYHLIQLRERIEPKAVKFEDLKDSVHKQLEDRWITERMKLLRAELGRRATESLSISDPALAEQFRQRLTRAESEIQQRDQIARELQRERESAQPATSRPALPQPTAPLALPKPAPATQPADETPAAPENGAPRPPATRSGSDTPDTPPGR